MSLESEHGSSRRRSVRVLIVEDVAQVASVLARVVRDEGARPERAASGAAALEAAGREPPPDLILLDVNLPDMSGLEVCRKLRADPRLRGVPIVMITGHAELELDGLEAGADDYLTKPFDLRKLKARISARLRRSGEAAEMHPMTRLPGSPAIRREVEERLSSGQEFYLCYADLHGFKHFNDTAGYHMGDALIMELAALLAGAVVAEDGDFLGHVGGDDFIMITRCRPESRSLEAKFSQAAAARLKGEAVDAGTVRLYAGIVHCAPGLFHRFEDVAAAASRAKKAARPPGGRT